MSAESSPVHDAVMTSWHYVIRRPVTSWRCSISPWQRRLHSPLLGCSSQNFCQVKRRLCWLITLFSLLTSALFLATKSLHVLYAPPTSICCRFLGCTQPLFPAVSALLAFQSINQSIYLSTGSVSGMELTPFALVHHIHSVVFLKPTASIRSSIPPSGSHKSLKFGLWPTRCT